MIRKINISLVGGQPMPIYIGRLATLPDLMVLVYSKQTKREAETIKSKCDIPIVLMEFPPTDYIAILNLAEAILRQFSNEQVVVNVSSGTKPWAVAFSMLSVGNENIQLLYVDQNNQVFNLSHKELMPTSFSLDIKTILSYNHQEASSYSNLARYTEADHNVLEQTKRLRRFNFRDFTTLTIPAKDKEWKNRLTKDSNPFLSIPLTGSSILFEKKKNTVTISLNKSDGKNMTVKLHSPHVSDIVFNAGWFEYQVATLFGEWNYTQEIWLNVKFPYTNGQAKNEIDIIVNLGGKLLFVECKTQIFDITDIDKFRTAVKNYGGLGSKALFITDTEVMKPEALQKCNDNDIIPYCLRKNKNKPKENMKDLFLLLEQELLNVNKK